MTGPTRTDRSPQGIYTRTASDWESSGGEAWARLWPQLDRGLSEVGDVLNQHILASTPNHPFRALDIGCGPGSTSLAIADARSDSCIIGCDLSAALIMVARERAKGRAPVRFEIGDAVDFAALEAPIDLFFSRHGVMFFADPVAAFRAFREAAAKRAEIVFSCFAEWRSNLWASALAEAAAGHQLPEPTREPSGFAFADPDYVRSILAEAGWEDESCRSVDSSYVAGEGNDALDKQ